MTVCKQIRALHHLMRKMWQVFQSKIYIYKKNTAYIFFHRLKLGWKNLKSPFYGLVYAGKALNSRNIFFWFLLFKVNWMFAFKL